MLVRRICIYFQFSYKPSEDWKLSLEYCPAIPGGTVEFYTTFTAVGRGVGELVSTSVSHRPRSVDDLIDVLTEQINVSQTTQGHTRNTNKKSRPVPNSDTQ